MENTSETKSVTLSFKTTPEEKTALQQIANEKNITRSELIASLIGGYKHHYDYIGKASPREAELQAKLNEVIKQNRKLTLALENAESRIEIEHKANRKCVKEQLEMNKTIFDLQEELKAAKTEFNRLNEAMKVSEPVSEDNNDSILLIGSIGSMVLTGLTLIFMPTMFKR